jgi:hypothetical protein
MGRVGGLTRGKDGNMHMGDMKRRLVAIISAIGASVPVAAGGSGPEVPRIPQYRVRVLRRRRHQPGRLA